MDVLQGSMTGWQDLEAAAGLVAGALAEAEDALTGAKIALAEAEHAMSEGDASEYEKAESDAAECVATETAQAAGLILELSSAVLEGMVELGGQGERCWTCLLPYQAD